MGDLQKQNVADLVQKAIGAYSSQFNESPEVGVWQFSTNGVATKGLFDIPSIGFGPGKEEEAHSPNEKLEVEQLVKAVMFYVSFVFEYAE